LSGLGRPSAPPRVLLAGSLLLLQPLRRPPARALALLAEGQRLLSDNSADPARLPQALPPHPPRPPPAPPGPPPPPAGRGVCPPPPPPGPAGGGVGGCPPPATSPSA